MSLFRDETPGRTRGRALQRKRAAHFAKNPLCVHCQQEGRITLATELDHVVALINGGADDGEVQGLCARCHRAKTQKDIRGEFFDAAFPINLDRVLGHLTLVCGPPGSGKSTYVKQHAKPGDLVLDLDEIVAEMTGLPIFHATREQALAGLHERNRRLKELSKTKHTVWLIVAAAGQAARDRWASMLGASDVVVMRTSEAECLRRIKADTRRRARYDERVRRWFRTEEDVQIGLDGYPIGEEQHGATQ